jgi:hypothetical protein
MKRRLVQEHPKWKLNPIKLRSVQVTGSMQRLREGEEKNIEATMEGNLCDDDDGKGNQCDVLVYWANNV